MEQYILKSAVVEEIERLKGKVNDDSSFSNGWKYSLRLLEIFVNGLDVKETVLQDSKTTKTIELGGIMYKPVPAKTNDKICKDCHYFLDNGYCCPLEECPCGDGLTILERVTEDEVKKVEVKEVNLEKEIELIKGDYEQVDVAWNNDFDFIAKHFFELGLKAEKDLTWQDIKLISEIGESFMNSDKSDNLSEEEYYTEILRRFKNDKNYDKRSIRQF